MADDIRISISDERRSGTWGKWLRGLIIAILPISVGIITGSAAMQWMGFLLTVMVGLVAAISINKKYLNLTIPEARKLLDEMEQSNG